MNVPSGKYLGLEVRNVRIVGQALARFDIYYQTSSSGVYNSDGVNVYVSCGTGYRHLGKLAIGYNQNSERYWGTFDFSIDNPDSWFYLTPYCEDSISPGSYPRFTVTGPSYLGYKGDLSYQGISSAGETYCTINLNIRNMFNEDMVYKDINGVYRTQALGATSSNGTSQNINYSMTDIPANTRFTNWSGLVPNGGNGDSPWAWLGNGQGSVTYATVFSQMDMPKISISRKDTTVTISWTGGGTYNKPRGDASRSGKIILMDSSKVAMTSAAANLEVNGSCVFNNIPANGSLFAVAEYTVNGLVDRSGNAKTYVQYSNEVYVQGISATANIKVDGVYKKTTNTYIKVDGYYKKVTEGYIKVDGYYKKIV